MRRSSLAVIPLIIATFGAGYLPTVSPALASSAADDTPTKLTPKGEHDDGSDEASFDKLRDAYYWSRLLAGDNQLGVDQAASLRLSASQKASGVANETVKGKPRGGTWVSQGRTRSSRWCARPTPSTP